MTTQRLRFLPKLIASLFLLPVASFAACTPEVRQYGGGGSGGASSSSSSSSGGMQCTGDTDCGASSECQSFACVDGSCQVTFAPMGTPVAIQAVGDCQTNVCDGKGYIVRVADLADATDDGNPCTLDACVGTETQHGNHSTGTECNTSQYCDGFGACVECLDNSHCANGICKANTCASPECTDNIKNGLETDIDCGGLQCPRCSDGAACVGDPDCKSLVCKGNICAPPTCMDMVRNGLETDVDCGGPDCLPCNPGNTCNAGLDCTSKVCVAGICKEPTCNDNIRNGNETGVDCGGGVCVKCGLGQGCFQHVDCSTEKCCPNDPPLPGYCEKLAVTCLAVLRSEITQ